MFTTYLILKLSLDLLSLFAYLVESVTSIYPIMLGKPIDPFNKLILTEGLIRANILIDYLGDPFPVCSCKNVVSFIRIFFDADDEFFSSDICTNVGVNGLEDWLGFQAADVRAVVIVRFGFDGSGNYQWSVDCPYGGQ